MNENFDKVANEMGLTPENLIMYNDQTEKLFNGTLHNEIMMNNHNNNNHNNNNHHNNNYDNDAEFLNSLKVHNDNNNNPQFTKDTDSIISFVGSDVKSEFSEESDVNETKNTKEHFDDNKDKQTTPALKFWNFIKFPFTVFLIVLIINLPPINKFIIRTFINFFSLLNITFDEIKCNIVKSFIISVLFGVTKFVIDKYE
jgi:hypothetical protein